MKNEIDKVSKKEKIFPLIRLLAEITAKRHKDKIDRHPMIIQEKIKKEDTSR